MQSKVDIETWLRNIIVLTHPKKKSDGEAETLRLEASCDQSVLAKRCCGCLTIMMEIEMINIGRKNKGCFRSDATSS